MAFNDLLTEADTNETVGNILAAAIAILFEENEEEIIPPYEVQCPRHCKCLFVFSRAVLNRESHYSAEYE